MCVAQPLVVCFFFFRFSFSSTPCRWRGGGPLCVAFGVVSGQRITVAHAGSSAWETILPSFGSAGSHDGGMSKSTYCGAAWAVWLSISGVSLTFPRSQCCGFKAAALFLTCKKKNMVDKFC